ncbi:hypothetical protein N657DRAFT_6089 [Parathielavia appendiculata]|uniref:Uncharacterized protein n=1 Tax=Parathielavia appendiculata TaxID=2587402 RepID=A0AAN6Z734_9PEZI|nr:hypothetical protein N657DRAFT_6089 [Parathielavia appendiculata]
MGPTTPNRPLSTWPKPSFSCSDKRRRLPWQTVRRRIMLSNCFHQNTSTSGKWRSGGWLTCVLTSKVAVLSPNALQGAVLLSHLPDTPQIRLWFHTTSPSFFSLSLSSTLSPDTTPRRADNFLRTLINLHYTGLNCLNIVPTHLQTSTSP